MDDMKLNDKVLDTVDKAAWHKWYNLLVRKFYLQTGFLTPGKGLPDTVWSEKLEKQRNDAWIKFLYEEAHNKE